MSTLYNYVYVQCPYFLRCNKTTITCEGISEGCVTSLEFKREKDNLLHKRVFCDDKYKNCEICRMLDEKNEEKGMDDLIKICKICGKGFSPAHHNSTLCSDECRAKSAKWEADCCKWKQCKEYEDLILNPHKKPTETTTKKLINKRPFCPYCGKPIKIMRWSDGRVN